MGLSISLVILKFLGIALSGGFGVLALLTEYKDDDGKITRWGWVALLGVLFSAVITASTQTVELVIKEAEAKEEQSRTLAQIESNTRLLTDINRGLNPLTDVRASFWLNVDLSVPELQGFARRLNNQITPLVRKWESETQPSSTRGAYASLRDMKGKVLVVSVGQDSELFPNRKIESFAHTIFEHSTITMYFYADPITIEEFPHYGAFREGVKQPDITMYFEQDYDSSPDISLEYEVGSKRFQVRGSGIQSDARYWESTGKIISLLDLAGAQVLITAGHSSVSFEEREKRIHPQVRSIVLDVGERKGLWFRSKKLTQYTDPIDGETIFEYKFPETLKEIEMELK